MNPIDEYESDFLLAIPCYREGKRLPPFLEELVTEVRDCPFSVKIQIVDDGSPEPEQSEFTKKIEAFRERCPEISETLAYSPNRGKGYAIGYAWNEASARYLAFIDADGSISARDAARIMKTVFDAKDDSKLVIATRRGSDALVKRSLGRRVISWLFNKLLRIRYDLEISDTQCGFKIVPSSFYRQFQSNFRQERFAFDIELILKAHEAGLSIEEIPVDWQEKPNGTLRFADGLSLYWDVLMKRI